MKEDGVIAIYTHKDIPGHNVLGDIIQDEELFASEYVTAIYQPLAVVIAGIFIIFRKLY